MSLEDKKREVEHLHDELSRTAHAILVDFRGLDVAGATDLRRRLRDQDAKFRVVKNSIALRAIEDLPLAELQDAFQGQTAIAYTGGDAVVLAKTLREFAKEFETPTFKAGVVDGEPITVEEFESIAELPSREELLAKALYLMQYPVSGLVTALNGILRGFVVALDQIRDKKDSGELPAGEPEAEAAPEPRPEEGADAGEAEAAETEVAGAGEPEAEAAGVEVPEAEAAGAEAPETEVAGAEAPETEVAGAEEPEAEAAPESAEQGDEEPEKEASAAEDEASDDTEAEVSAAGEADEEAAGESDEEPAAGEDEEIEE